MPNAEITVRRADPNDAAAIKQIHVKAYQVSYRGYIPDSYLDTLTADAQSIERTRHYLKEAECCLAVKNNKPMGFAYICYPEDNCFEIQALYVDPDCQNQGAGSALVQALFKQKQTDYKKCVVWTMKNGPSRGFYQKMGFTPTQNEKIWKFGIPIIMLEHPFP